MPTQWSEAEQVPLGCIGPPFTEKSIVNRTGRCGHRPLQKHYRWSFCRGGVLPRPYTTFTPPYPVTKASGKPAAFTFSQYSSALRRKRKAPTCTRYSGVSSTGGSGVSAGSPASGST